MARQRQTLMDYMVIGISPALIMGMVGSLLFFLLTVFYRGEYSGRLTFICAMFTMAIVLIARISMERGIEYASMFGFALAFVTFLAMLKFVVITGPLAGMSHLINCLLIGVVWWSAHKLTWDCTFIDDQQDASGEGLLQAVGFDADTVEHQVKTVQPGGAQASASEEDGRTPATAERSGPEWYQRMIARRRRPHTPGVWVLYYALAALPLFGLGQWLIPPSFTDSRWHAFRLICVYVACALGLLLTTSFLGLRRYLRQRNLQMPLDMAGLWLGAGAVMIIGVLLVCMVLPRPGATLTVSQLPFGFGSPDHQRTSPHALGNDGPERPPEATRTSPRAKQPPTASAASSDQKASATSGAESGKQESSKSESQSSSSDSSQSSSDGAKPKTPQSGDTQDKPSQQNDSPSPSPSPSPSQNNGQPSRNDNRSSSDQNPDQSSGGDQPRDSQQPGEREADRARNSAAGGHKMREQQPEDGPQFKSDQQESEPTGDPQQADEQDAPRESSSASRARPQWNPSQALTTVARAAGSLLKLLFFAALVVVAIYFAWKHHVQLRQALGQLWRDLLNLWASLWGRRPAVDDATPSAADQPTGPPLPSFASYRDPFVAGLAERYTMEQLVRYSFEALEAWGREHACPRDVDQTPLEYAQLLARHHARIGPETHVLAELYCRLAYGREQIATRRRDDLRRLWQQLRAPV